VAPGPHPALSSSTPETSALESSAGSSPIGRRGVRTLTPYFVYRAGATVARALPRDLAAGLGWVGGLVYGRTARGRRAMVRRHLRRINPGLSRRVLERAVDQTFESYARYWVESFRLPGSTPADLDAGLTSYEGLEHLEGAWAKGKGVIMAVPHLGGWDFGGAWLSLVGGYRVVVVVEPVRPPELFEWFAELRRSLGLEIIPLGEHAATAVLRTLRQGGLVCLVCDRDIPGNGVEVDFLGERTTLPSGPATLALRTGAAILPSSVYFKPYGGHHGVVLPSIPTERLGSFREDTVRITQLLADELANLIRRAPEQWHLLQPNWPSDLAVTDSGSPARGMRRPRATGTGPEVP
jgi:lauroyl/myristoyl acyltransferase